MKKAMKLAALISAVAMMSGMLLPLPVRMEIPAAITASAEDDEEYTEGSISSLYYAKYSDHVAITGFESDKSTFEIPETIEGLPVTCIDTGAFASSTMTGITIPKTVTTIKEWAFSTCLDLKSITLPDSVDYIGAQAFDLCTSLNNVELPDHFVRIENEAFTGTPWIERLRSQDPMVIVNGILLDGTTLTGAVELPSTVKYIAAGAFYKNDKLTSVVIPAAVKEVPDSTFFMCENLTSVEMEGVEVIGSTAFAYCDKLTDVKINGKAKTIEPLAFMDSTGTATITVYGTEADWKSVDIQDESEFLTKAKYVFDPSHTVPEDKPVIGDVNGDGAFSVLDVVAFQKWLAVVPGATLKDAQAGDLDKNGVLDIFDLALMKHALHR